MATEKSKFRIILLLNFLAFAFTSATPLSIPLGSVSDLLIQSALDSLNENAQTHHTYKSGNLISAQKLEQPPYKVYKLTLNLEPNCNEEAPCPREACAIDLRQHELGVIDVQRNSIQCMYLYPQSVQTDMQQLQPIQDGLREISNTPDQETTESLDKHLINDSVQLDHEVQTVTDGIERPFIAVRATDRNYCAGCPYELNPTLPGLGAFGEEVVRSMDDTGRRDFKHKVISIVRVTRAVPPGSNVILYELLLEIGESNCPRTATIDRNECSLIANVPVQLCLVTFEQRPWQHESRKIVRNNCTDFPESYNEIDTSFDESRATRQTLGTVEAEVPSTENVVSRINEQTSGDTNNGEKTLLSYSSTIDEYFNNPVESTSSSATSIDDKTRILVNEEASKKIVIHKEEDEQSKKTVGFKNKFKEFDDFLDDFDLPIKARDPEPVDPRKPVNEEIIIPEKIARPEKKNEPSSVNSNGDEAKRSIRSIFDYTKEESVLIDKLAQKVVDELDQIDPDDKKRVLLGVLDSKKQPGNDTIYYITMKVATSNCLEGMKHCDDDRREPAKICKAQIYVAAKKSLDGAKILQSQCFDEIKRRETRVRRHIVGASAQRKVDDPEIKEYVAKGLSKYSETLNAEREPFLVEIVEATVQIVAGTLFKIKVRLGESTCPKSVKENCQLREGSQVDNYLITVFSQPWVDNDKPEITIEHLEENNAGRSRRSSRRLGGPTLMNPEDPEIRTYAEKGLNKHSESLGAERQPFLVRIVEATSQVVSGKLYKIKVQFGESTCPKGVKENCQLKEGSQVDDYLISVWSQPWVDHGNPEITVEPLKKHNVNRIRRSSGKPGGTTPISPNDPEIRAYAEKGLNKHSESLGAERQPFLVRIVEATSQVVSGKLYKIKVQFGESTCPKGVKENCQLKEGSQVDDYLISVWSQPWIDHGNPEITVKPLEKHNVNRIRRSSGMPGGTTPISPNDPEIRAYAEKGLNKHSESLGAERQPFLVRIVEATSQVVSGKLYKIKVQFGESTCPKGVKENCQLKEGSQVDDYLISVWSQPWVDHGNPEITVKPLEKHNVNRIRRSSGMPGGTTPISPSDPEIRAYAEKGLNKHSESLGAERQPFLVRIVEATSQVVSGKLYKIKVQFGESTCPKGVKENCQLKEGSQVDDYLISVWSQPWVDHGNPEITVERWSDRKISKRSLKGQGYTEKMQQLYKDIENERAFDRFINEHEKTYVSEDEKKYRFGVFLKNMKIVEELQRTEEGTGIYGATIFADLTPEEFRLRHLGLNPKLRSDNDIPLPMAEIPNIELPKEFDWRHSNVVTAVKNQGSCGSCWAFAVTGNIEGLNAIKHGKLISLSEQELVDCDKLDQGCNGGLPDSAYRAIEELGGLELETDYPYDGANEKCHFDKSKARVNVVSGVNITSNETQMAQWLVQNGPIAIGINANAMQFYMGGISHPYKFLCNPTNLDHGVLIVGYGIHTYPIFKKSMPYWIIKNSWGPRWGEQGYYRVYRGDGTCGVNQMASSAVIA